MAVNGTEKLAKALLLPINTAAVILLGIFTVVWGVWVANPFWTVFTQAQMYSVLSSLAPEVFWGSVAIFCGLVICWGAFKRHYRPLVIGASVAFWHWLMIAIFYLLGDIFDTGGIVALFLAVYAVYIYLNIRVNFKNDKRNPEILH
jgi:hypothetical protein